LGVQKKSVEPYMGSTLISYTRCDRDAREPYHTKRAWLCQRRGGE
jgi:hypothetical protein